MITMALQIRGALD